VLANLSKNQWITAITNAVRHCKGEDEVVAFFILSALREGLVPEGAAPAGHPQTQA